jgi:hypothetical protein
MLREMLTHSTDTRACFLIPDQISTEEKAAGHVPRTAPKSRYARPVTPGLIRKIIREEVVSAVKGSSPTGDPRYADLAGGHPNLIAPENGGRLASLHATMHQGPLAGEVDLNAAVVRVPEATPLLLPPPVLALETTLDKNQCDEIHHRRVHPQGGSMLLPV